MEQKLDSETNSHDVENDSTGTKRDSETKSSETSPDPYSSVTPNTN